MTNSTTSQNKKINKLLRGALKLLFVSAFWIGVWCLLSLKINNSFLFPDPKAVLSVLGKLISTADFWQIAVASLYRVFVGVILSLIIGIVTATLTHRIKILNTLISPLLSMIKSTPVASFIILACVWLDRSALPMFITALIVIPIVWSNISSGLSSVDKSLVEVAEIYRFSLAKRIFKLYIPWVAPYFLASCRSSLGMAWKAAIAAEVLATPDKAIGTELYLSKTYMETPTMFAWTLVIILLSIIFEKLFVGALEKIGDRFHLSVKGGSTNAENN
jgi:NitT/TauT family transport system permease protein